MQGIVYRPLSETRISDLASRSFDPAKSCHHYLSMAKSCMREHLEGPTVKLKKYFYAIRPILAARHVLAKHTQPPMLFADLSEEYLDARLVPAVDKLLDMKRNGGEGLRIPRNDELNAWIAESLVELETLANSLPRTVRLPWDEYNKFFLDLLGLRGKA